MQTTIDEISPDVFRLATFVPEVAAPAGFTFNQFLVRDEEPFLYHTGMRGLFPQVSEALSQLIDLTTLRWISFAHVEADECGAMNAFLAVAPNAQVVHGETAVGVSLNDLCDRAPRAMADDEVLTTGRHRLRFLATPHVPHSWESGLWLDEVADTMFVGDIFGQTGAGPAVRTDDIVGPAIAAEEQFQSLSGGPQLMPTLDRLARYAPGTLAVMHGSSFRGDSRSAFADFAAGVSTIGAVA